MDVTQVISVLSNTGFPVIMCCILIWYIDKRDKEYQSAIDKLSSAIDHMTKSLQTIEKRIGIDQYEK